MLLFTLPERAWQVVVLVILAAPTIGTLWAPSMAMLSDGAEALGIAQGFAFALSNLGWSIGQTAGSAASAGLADATSDAVPVRAALGRLRRHAGRAGRRPPHRDEPHMTALDDAVPRPFWLDRPDAPAARPPLDGVVEADLVVVGGGLTGLWTALPGGRGGQARRAARGRAARVRRARDATAASARRRSPTASRTALRAGPARWRRSSGSGARTSTGSRETIARHGIDVRLGGDGHDRRRHGAAPARRGWPRPGRAAPALRLGRRAARRRGDARAGATRRPTSAACGRATACALVDPARLCWGLARAAEAAGADDPRGDARDRRSARDGAGVRADDAGRARARPPRAARHERVPAARARDPALRRAGLRLRARHRAAVGGAARRDRLARARRGSPTSPTSSTTTARPPTTGSSGAATTRSTTSAGASAPERDQRPATFALLAEHFFDTFPQLEGLRFTHRWGGAIDTCSRFSALWGTRARRARRLRRRLHRARASAPAASAPASGSTCSTGSTPSARGSRWSAGGRCRSRPSRCAGRASQLTRRALARADAARGPARAVAAHARPPRARLRLLNG